MENEVIQTWKCPECGEEGNTENFCTKCGTPKPVEKTEKPKRDMKRVFNAIISVVMIVFFSTSLIYILTPVIDGDKSVGGYYFLWEAWPQIKNIAAQSSKNLEIGKTIAGLVAFLIAAVLVYIHSIKGLINSILVLKKGAEVQYSKDLAWVVATTLIYYGLVYSLYWERGYTYYETSNGGGKVYAVMSMIFALIALLIGSFILGCHEKNGGKIATSAIRFVSGIFGISGTLTAMKGSLRMATGSTTADTAFVLQAIKQFMKGDAGETTAGIMFIIVGILILLAVAAGALSVATSFKCLVKEEKNSALTYISGFISAALIVAALVSSSIFITIIDFGTITAVVNGTLATALTCMLISSVGLIVANLLDRK
ncbi:MAG: zinc ribbon domain-containing protein [Bacilli bacterium]|nr:zinc ribbon domain-containing protein [Bacilli bacterium]